MEIFFVSLQSQLVMRIKWKIFGLDLDLAADSTAHACLISKESKLEENRWNQKKNSRKLPCRHINLAGYKQDVLCKNIDLLWSACIFAFKISSNIVIFSTDMLSGIWKHFFLSSIYVEFSIKNNNRFSA